MHKNILSFHVQRSNNCTTHISGLFHYPWFFSSSSLAILFISARTSTEFSPTISKKNSVIGCLHVWSSLARQLLLQSTHITEDIWHYFGCGSKCADLSQCGCLLSSCYCSCNQLFLGKNLSPIALDFRMTITLLLLIDMKII